MICRILCAGLALLMFGASARALDASTPSILLLTVDNLRPDRMSVYGYEKKTTPYLERFAAESLVFERAFSTSAWTAPGMVSMFTGYYPPVHAQHGRFSYYDEQMTAAFRVLAANGYEIYGQAIKGPSHQGFGFRKRLGKWPRQLEDFIESRVGNDEPFFAWAHITDVHLPYDPSDRNTRRFGAGERSNAAIEAVRKHRIILRHPEKVTLDLDHAGKVEFGPEDIEQVRALYDAEVADVDERLQGHLERMREIGLLDRTIVIIAADHGEELFEHGWLGHASTGYDAKLYDELIRIPLIIRMPGGGMRGRFDAMVQGVDLMPTLFEILGLNPDAVEPQMQGRSLMPVINRERIQVRDYVFNQTTLKGWTTPRDEMGARIVSVRSADRKLIRIPSASGTRTEAYDLKRDPQELKNVYPARKDEFRGLEVALDAWFEDNRNTAARLVMSAAERHIEKIADALLVKADLDAAVDSWSAIQTMHETWGFEPRRFYDIEPYRSQWLELRRSADAMIGMGLTCRSRGAEVSGPLLSGQGDLDDWQCK